ncbi:transporter substrate-binding domain-containing protein [uncultured Negativibacillus sp.]|uniref:transporter substrate-binding domain-containing protein n=1 Tax=uncultured Negativibacillus sp. TaxID=1980696 RepID=UPI0025E3C8A8|nr:transporter substrate-binding domain-containing protein [uncultured Negativibacillus sp.]
MNTMKKLLTALLCGAMVLSMAACGGSDSESAEGTGSDDNKIYVGTEAGFAPYEYMSGDEVVGVDMDIAQAIADAMGKELVIKNMDFDGALNAVQQGQVDFVAAAVSVDEERQKVMDFSHNYVDSSDVVVVNASAGVVNTNEDIADKVIGVQQGNIADIWVTDNYPDAEVKRYTKFVQAAEDLKNNKIDAIVMDLYPAQELVAANPELKILDENNPLFVDQYAIAVKKGNQELLDQINEVIDQLIADGKIEEFTANHATAK